MKQKMKDYTYYLEHEGDPRKRYSFEVNRSIDDRSVDVVARDHILGTWRRLRVPEVDLETRLNTWSPYEFAVNQLARQMDAARDKIVHPLYTAVTRCLLDYYARWKVYEILRLLDVGEGLRGMSPYAPCDYYRTSEARDAACRFVHDNPDVESYEEFCIKMKLSGMEPTYTKDDFETVREVFTAMKKIPEPTVFYRGPNKWS